MIGNLLLFSYINKDRLTTYKDKDKDLALKDKDKDEDLIHNLQGL